SLHAALPISSATRLRARRAASPSAPGSATVGRCSGSLGRGPMRATGAAAVPGAAVTPCSVSVPGGGPSVALFSMVGSSALLALSGLDAHSDGCTHCSSFDRFVHLRKHHVFGGRGRRPGWYP